MKRAYKDFTPKGIINSEQHVLPLKIEFKHMKKLSIPFFIIISTLLQSCFLIETNGGDSPEQSQYQPITMLRSDFENSTTFLPTQTIINSGKIYVKDQYLFVNEINEGFHILNNSNPETPENIGFLKVLGSTDIAIKGNILYINNASDLISIVPNFENSTIEITNRISNTFSNALTISPDGLNYYYPNNDEVIVGWELIN